ncbi:MAG: transcription termination factor Rho, partial [Thermoleophilaceae bacterium]|nr:transcription termination factor Rho [Thermoleophilaceae bacterium]
MPVLDRKELEESPLSDLHAIASELGIEGYRRLRREELIDALSGGAAAEKPKPRSRSRAKKSDDKPAAESRKESSDEDDDDEQPRPRRQRSRRSRPSARGSSEDAPAKAAEQEDEPDDDADTEVRQGVLDILPNGSGFMRPDPFAHSREDVYVSPAQ